MVYPLDVGGRDDYPVKVGSMLLTMVDPHIGFEKAYNRWYERDHYYTGCMVGPWMFAGSRWVAPRQLKDLRWPDDETIAAPFDAGSYVSIYWVEQGRHEEHFTDWSVPQVRWIYQNGRGFAERRHIHTVLFHFVGAGYRDGDGVPVDLALDARYDGIVAMWFDAEGDRNASDLHADLMKELIPSLLAGSPIESVSSWTPSGGDAGDAEERQGPMDLGTRPGGSRRLCQLLFVRGSVEDVLGRIRTYTDAAGAQGLATIRLVAPFYATAVGTDTYADQLW